MTDWPKELQEQGEIALRTARNASTALQASDLTAAQVETITKMVRHGANTFDSIIEVMVDENANNLNELAGQIREVWTLLVATAEERFSSASPRSTGEIERRTKLRR